MFVVFWLHRNSASTKFIDYGRGILAIFHETKKGGTKTRPDNRLLYSCCLYDIVVYWHILYAR